MTSPPTLESRLARVEQVIAALSREVAAIRTELGSAAHVADQAPVAPSIDAQPAAPSAPRPSRSARSMDFEALLGRYGMLGIAVFAAVAAVGTFLSWAIGHGYLVLGPGARVLLGLAFAAGIGAWGVRLRRTERSFGSSLIGLALVIVLVCAYAAGPWFHLIPTSAAFLAASGVAWALAFFARIEEDEPLWCVAFGGASIAPFATSDGAGSLYALLAYGIMLLVFGCFGIGHRGWPVAWRVFYLSAALMGLSADWLARAHGAFGVLATLAFPLIVGAAGVMPFAPDSRKRAALRWLAFLTLAAAVSADRLWYSALYPSWTPVEGWQIAGAILGAAGLWLVIVDRSTAVAQSSLLAINASSHALLDWIDVAILPLLLASEAGRVLSPSRNLAIVYAVSAVMLFAFMWRRSVGSARDAAAFAFMTVAALALLELAPRTPAIQIALLLGLSLVALVLHRVRSSRSWVLVGAFALFVAILANVDTLTTRPIYAFTPFATVPSLTALGATATLVIIALRWRWVFEATCESMGSRKRRMYARPLRAILKTAVTAPWVWAFFWVLIELSMAYSASTSTLLLVTYFATTGVASVAAGRMRNAPRVRQIGLALAVVAAGTAVYGASTYFDSGTRIVAYLVTSAFLLGIAFWYRRPGTTTTADA